MAGKPTKKKGGWAGVTWEGYVDVSLVEGQKGELKEYLRDEIQVAKDFDTAVAAMGYKIGVGRSPDGHGYRTTLTGQDGGQNPGYTLCGYGSTPYASLACALYKDFIVLKHIWPINSQVVDGDYFR